jgi:hypothetical protein
LSTPEYTPGNLTKAQWAIPLNKLALGGEDIPTIQQTSTYFFKKLWLILICVL